MRRSSEGKPAVVPIDARRPEWTQDESIRYEVAREAITALMAFRSQWIFEEEEKPLPDKMAIEQWETERAQFASELHGLSVYDQRKLASICRRYGPEIKRLDELELRRTGVVTKPVV